MNLGSLRGTLVPRGRDHTADVTHMLADEPQLLRPRQGAAGVSPHVWEPAQLCPHHCSWDRLHVLPGTGSSPWAEGACLPDQQPAPTFSRGCSSGLVMSSSCSPGSGSHSWRQGSDGRATLCY